jgi:hypothetical protein
MRAFPSEEKCLKASPPSIREYSRMKNPRLRSRSKKKKSKSRSRSKNKNKNKKSGKSKTGSKKLQRIKGKGKRRVYNKVQSIHISAESGPKSSKKGLLSKKKKVLGGSSISSVLFLQTHRLKPYAIERSPVEHNNKQESHEINDKVDEYLFLMLDSLKPFNFNIRDMRKEYKNIKSLLKDQVRKRIETKGTLVIDNKVIMDFLLPLVKFPSMVILPAFIGIILAQVSSPVNTFFINLAIVALVYKLLSYKFFMLNIMKTPYQNILICSVLVLLGLTNFFQALFATGLFTIGFWAYQIQIFLMIFLTCLLIGNMGWILYELIDTFYSWNRYR